MIAINRQARLVFLLTRTPLLDKRTKQHRNVRECLQLLQESFAKRTAREPMID
jgi:hypothetical protein